MIVFSLVLFICTEATECRWITAMHFVREDLCHELGREYLIEPKVQRYRCTVSIRE